MHVVIMKTDQETDQEIAIGAKCYAARVTRVIDRDFDLLRARAWERSVWAIRIQRVRDMVTAVMAIAMGSLAGWLFMR